MDDPTAPAPLSDLDETRRLLLETLGRSDLSEGSPVSELALASVATIAGEVVHLLNAYRSEIDTIARRVDPSADQAVSERVGEMIEDIIAHRAAGAGWRAAVQDAGASSPTRTPSSSSSAVASPTASGGSTR